MRNVAPWMVVVALAVSASAVGAAEVGFSAQPKAEREGEKVKVRFAVSAATDVEVSVLDKAGGVVRHLAAGVLGKNAPPPLKSGSLSQQLVWDGRDDDGRPAAAGRGPFRVRVRLGLGAELDRFIATPACRLNAPVVGLGVGPDGSVYVLANRDKAGGLSLYVLDRDGRYLRTLLPAPANLANEQLKDLERVKLADGSRVPIIYQPYTADTVPFSSGLRRQQLAISKTGWIVFASGGNNWTDQSVPRHVLVVKTDGSTPAEVGFVGPTLGRHGRYSIGLRPQQLALSPDGRTLYFAGMGTGKTKRQPAKGIHVVGRLTWDSTGGPKPFIGAPEEPGDDAAHLNDPVSVTTDAKGNLYVADLGNSRVAAFDSAGEPLGQTKVERPGQVCVGSAEGPMYVLTEPVGRRWEPFALIKFDKAVSGREVARLDLKGRGAVVALDSSAKPPRLWLAYSPGWRVPYQLLPVLDGGDKLQPGESLFKSADQGFTSPLYLTVDPARSRLYVGDFSRKILRVDLKTDKTSKFLTASEAALDRDGNLYVLHGYGTNTLLRLTPDGQPLPFSSTGSHKLEVVYRAGLPHVGTRGLTVSRTGDLYVFQDNNMGAPERVQVFGPDGKLKHEALIAGIPFDSGNGIAVDRAGNIYAGINVHDPNRLYPDVFTGVVPPTAWYMMYTTRSSWYQWPQRGVPKPPWSRAYMNFYLFHYGSVFKFPPAGGRFWTGGRPKADGKNPRPEGVPPDATEFRAAYLKTVVWGKGFLWRYRGFALNPNRTESWGDPACSCMNSRFTLDEHERLFVPDVFRFSIGVLDTAGNEIARFGAYGNVDTAGPDSAVPTPAVPFGFPTAVAVGGGRAYVADRKNRRIVVVKLTFAAEAECPVP